LDLSQILQEQHVAFGSLADCEPRTSHLHGDSVPLFVKILS